MPSRYTIVVQGRLSSRWEGEFGELRVRPRDDGTTALVGRCRDQSDLHGQLRRIEDLGLTLVSLEKGGSEP